MEAPHGLGDANHEDPGVQRSLEKRMRPELGWADQVRKWPSKTKAESGARKQNSCQADEVTPRVLTGWLWARRLEKADCSGS